MYETGYELPHMTPAEKRIWQRLTKEQQRDVHYEGWSAVWKELTAKEKQALQDDFWTYGDR